MVEDLKDGEVLRYIAQKVQTGEGSIAGYVRMIARRWVDQGIEA